MKFQVYRPFGRIVANFPIGNELHHHALERARQFGLTHYGVGGRWWIRLVR